MFGFNFTDIIFHFLDDSVYFRVQLFPMFVQGCCRFLGVCNKISFQHRDARCYVLVFGLNSFCSNSCKSICMPSFFICSAFTKSANARPMCSLEVTECKQTGLLHCSQQSSHFYLNVLDILGHLGSISRDEIGTTLCSLEISERCSSTQALHKCV